MNIKIIRQERFCSCLFFYFITLDDNDEYNDNEYTRKGIDLTMNSVNYQDMLTVYSKTKIYPSGCCPNNRCGCGKNSNCSECSCSSCGSSPCVVPITHKDECGVNRVNFCPACANTCEKLLYKTDE